jgi:hypothetical protein
VQIFKKLTSRKINNKKGLAPSKTITFDAKIDKASINGLV